MQFDALKIGQFYSVPCVRVLIPNFSFADKGEWVPVLLPEHADPEIGFPMLHHHLDFRFLTDRQYKRANLGSVVWKYSPVAEIELRDGQRGPIKYRRIKCRRHAPAVFPHAQAKWGEKLENAYADKKLQCGKCPHRGVDLSGLPSGGGIVVCPARGLMWDMATGEMVRVVTGPNAAMYEGNRA